MRFLDRLDNFANNRLYISYIRRFFNISKKDSLDIIEILVNLDIVEPRYKIQFSERFLPIEYDYMREIPSTIFDEELHEDIPIDFNKNVFVFFKVIANE